MARRSRARQVRCLKATRAAIATAANKASAVAVPSCDEAELIAEAAGGDERPDRDGTPAAGEQHTHLKRSATDFATASSAPRHRHRRVPPCPDQASRIAPAMANGMYLRASPRPLEGWSRSRLTALSSVTSGLLNRIMSSDPQSPENSGRLRQKSRRTTATRRFLPLPRDADACWHGRCRDQPRRHPPSRKTCAVLKQTTVDRGTVASESRL